MPVSYTHLDAVQALKQGKIDCVITVSYTHLLQASEGVLFTIAVI